MAWSGVLEGPRPWSGADRLRGRGCVSGESEHGTERGRAGYERYRHDFSKLIWKLASPKWNFDDATFDRTATSFDNPDHVAIVIHNYRWRLGLAEGERSMTIWKSGWPSFR